jgi:hypothetical protein
MSGGSYDYFTYKAESAAGTLRERHPREPHVLALAELLFRVADVMYDIEWADSSDTSWTEALDAKIRALVSPPEELTIAVEQAERCGERLAVALDRARLYAQRGAP